MDRTLVMLAAVFMFLGVAAGAFGAHGLRSYFAQQAGLEATFDTAVRYHLIHGLALFVAAWAAERWPGSPANWAGYLFVAGIVIFAGSLYMLVLTRMRWLGAITPVGGLAFLAGWLCLLWAAWRN
jgi:uncharacterized membrane protein YgdD (TMEM256/DUF423 family)